MFSKRTIVANEYNANTNCTKSIYSRLRQIRRLVLVSVFFRRSMDIQFLFGQKNTKGKNSRNKSILYTHICNFIPTVQGISSHCEKKMLNFFSDEILCCGWLHLAVDANVGSERMVDRRIKYNVRILNVKSHMKMRIYWDHELCALIYTSMTSFSSSLYRC